MYKDEIIKIANKFNLGDEFFAEMEEAITMIPEGRMDMFDDIVEYVIEKHLQTKLVLAQK